MNFQNCIKYAWENDPKILEKCKTILKNTDVLIIIGYSFPAFNRKIDSELLKSLKQDAKIYYQDPFASKSVINNIQKSINQDFKIELIDKEIDLKNFYIPNEYLFPPEDPNIYI